MSDKLYPLAHVAKYCRSERKLDKVFEGVVSHELRF